MEIPNSIQTGLNQLQEAIAKSNKSYTPEAEDVDLKEKDEQAKALKNKRYESDTADRKWLAEWATTLVSIWLFFVLIILMGNNYSLHLSDSVLNVLLGTTTINVLGLMAIVLRGHFNAAKE